ncbi:glycosyltransferase [Flavobacteriaceae bacterium MHTCC 0001]
MNELVSIIIPTYNRGNIIEETLNSVLQQTYHNWECIIVDDGSTDNTDTILKKICERDPRFIYTKRPTNRVKGANSCRNYGLELSQGTYINWFDSDDYMFPQFIEKKINVLKNKDSDFVISKSMFFYENDITKNKPYNYTLNQYKITHYNFICHKINWLTPDFMVLKKVLNNKILFNEKLLTTAQEYNFFSRLTASTTNGVFINEVLTGYRQHENSIEANLERNKNMHSKELCLGYFYTIKDLGGNIEKEVSVFLHESIIRRSLDVKLPSFVINRMIGFIFKMNKKACVFYIAYQLIYKHFVRKHFLNTYKYQTKWE